MNSDKVGLTSAVDVRNPAERARPREERASLPGSPPTSEDIQFLGESSWLTPEIIEQALIRRVDDAEAREVVGVRERSSENYAGLLFPYVLPGEQHVREYRLRRDAPPLEQKADGTTKERNKYLSPPGRGNMLYFVPCKPSESLTDTNLPVAIAEGGKKALALHRLSTYDSDAPRFLPVGIAGVWNWRGTVGKTTGPKGDRRDVQGAIPDLDRITWKKRRVYLVFDANVNTNESVRAARQKLSWELQRRGAEILLVEFPTVFKMNGVDDFLVQDGPEATLQLFENAQPAEMNIKQAGVVLGELRKRLEGSKNKEQRLEITSELFLDSSLDAGVVMGASDSASLQRLLIAFRSAGLSQKDCDRFCAEVRGRQRRRHARTQGSSIESTFPYTVLNGVTVYHKETQQGQVAVPLCNFVARIVAEVVHDDGVERKTFFEIEGQLKDGTPLPRALLPTDQFTNMSWVTKHWGVRAVVCAGQMIKDHLRVAIQVLSGNPPRREVFAHLGWRKADGRYIYLHADGAIGPEGPEPGVELSLSVTLCAYQLPDPPKGDERIRAVRASLNTLRTAPHRITAPVLAAVYRSVLAPADFAVHLSGLTGAGKTEEAAIAQQHFGAGMDARNLPGSRLSTGNALEALAFAAKDALLAVDDFAPTGSVYDVQRYHREADRLIRAQGNRAGRLRLRSDATLRPVKRARGLILSTGEDIPRGESLRARLLTVEVAPTDVDWDQLSISQLDARQGLLAQALAAFIQWVALDYKGVQRRLLSDVEELRGEALQSFAHKRIPEIIANLGAGLRFFLELAQEIGAIAQPEAEQLWKSCWQALGETARLQAKHHAASEPTRRFLECLNAAISSGKAHVASPKGKEPGEDPEAWGWRSVTVGTRDNARDEWRHQGDRVGWRDGGDLYLEPSGSFAAAQDFAKRLGDPLTIGPYTLRKRLNEKGLLASTGASESRETLLVRRTLEGHRLEVLHLKASSLRPKTEPNAVVKDLGGQGFGQVHATTEPNLTKPEVAQAPVFSSVSGSSRDPVVRLVRSCDLRGEPSASLPHKASGSSLGR